MAILGGYLGLYVLYSIGSSIGGSSKKKTETAAATAAPTSSTDSNSSTTTIPSIDSPEFEKYMESEAFMKILESDELLASALEKL
jgi:hypothetical protein